MARFLVRRVLTGLLVMWMVTVLSFGLFFIDPNGPQAVAHRIGGKSATPDQIANIIHRLGLKDPLVVQYWHFLWGSSTQNGLLKGSLGHDFYYGISVNHIIAQ